MIDDRDYVGYGARPPDRNGRAARGSPLTSTSISRVAASGR
jgi:hypothetical protein